MTRLSTPKMVGLIMGAWFLASGAGNFAAAQIAQLTSADGGGADQVIEVYATVGKLAVGVGIALIVLSPLIKRMMHLDTLEADTKAYNAKHGITMDGEDMVGERMSPTGKPLS